MDFGFCFLSEFNLYFSSSFKDFLSGSMFSTLLKRNSLRILRSIRILPSKKDGE